MSPPAILRERWPIGGRPAAEWPVPGGQIALGFRPCDPHGHYRMWRPDSVLAGFLELRMKATTHRAARAGAAGSFTDQQSRSRSQWILPVGLQVKRKTRPGLSPERALRTPIAAYPIRWSRAQTSCSRVMSNCDNGFPGFPLALKPNLQTAIEPLRKEVALSEGNSRTNKITIIVNLKHGIDLRSRSGYRTHVQEGPARRERYIGRQAITKIQSDFRY